MNNTITNVNGQVRCVTGVGVDALRLKAIYLALRLKRDTGMEMGRYSIRTVAKRETGLKTNNLDTLMEAIRIKMNAAIDQCEITTK